MHRIEKESASYLETVAPRWTKLLAQAVRNTDELCDLLELDDDFRAGARRAAADFPLVAPRGFVARMKKGDPNDPLLRQVLPVSQETEAAPPLYAVDPVGDGRALRAPGMLKKYAGRALLMAAGICAVHCRYCFRRHYPYDETPVGL
ncbi:MAG: EF-P beta-lysylation protein EpmB, partial [Planctomycetia bacterium]